MSAIDTSEKYSRQVILPGVGQEGQKKWGSARVLLAGEGVALQAAATALTSVGVSDLSVLVHGSFDATFLVSAPRNLELQAVPLTDELPKYSIVVVVSQDAGFRRQLNRNFRKRAQPALFAWPAGTGYALFLSRYAKGECPCLECFETLNPKVFTKGEASVERLLGAMAASEALQWILGEKSPLENKVWITSLEAGVSFHHDVAPSYKCPAKMIADGAKVTP